MLLFKGCDPFEESKQHSGTAARTTWFEDASIYDVLCLYHQSEHPPRLYELVCIVLFRCSHGVRCVVIGSWRWAVCLSDTRNLSPC